MSAFLDQLESLVMQEMERQGKRFWDSAQKNRLIDERLEEVARNVWKAFGEQE